MDKLNCFLADIAKIDESQIAEILTRIRAEHGSLDLDEIGNVTDYRNISAEFDRINAAQIPHHELDRDFLRYQLECNRAAASDIQLTFLGVNARNKAIGVILCKLTFDGSEEAIFELQTRWDDFDKTLAKIKELE